MLSLLPKIADRIYIIISSTRPNRLICMVVDPNRIIIIIVIWATGASACDSIVIFLIHLIAYAFYLAKGSIL